MNIDSVEYASAVDQSEWDELVVRLGGGFFHCHAYALHEAIKPNSKPLFIRAFDQQGCCVGAIVGTIFSPRFWPFSKICRHAFFGALPATREKSVDLERAIMAVVEEELRRRGVFRIDVCSYDSPNSA